MTRDEPTSLMYIGDNPNTGTVTLVDTNTGKTWEMSAEYFRMLKQSPAFDWLWAVKRKKLKQP